VQLRDKLASLSTQADNHLNKITDLHQQNHLLGSDMQYLLEKHEEERRDSIQTLDDEKDARGYYASCYIKVQTQLDKALNNLTNQRTLLDTDVKSLLETNCMILSQAHQANQTQLIEISLDLDEVTVRCEDTIEVLVRALDTLEDRLEQCQHQHQQLICANGVLKRQRIVQTAHIQEQERALQLAEKHLTESKTVKLASSTELMAVLAEVDALRSQVAGQELVIAIQDATVSSDARDQKMLREKIASWEGKMVEEEENYFILKDELERTVRQLKQVEGELKLSRVVQKESAQCKREEVQNLHEQLLLQQQRSDAQQAIDNVERKGFEAKLCIAKDLRYELEKRLVEKEKEMLTSDEARATLQKQVLHYVQHLKTLRDKYEMITENLGHLQEHDNLQQHERFKEETEQGWEDEEKGMIATDASKSTTIISSTPPRPVVDVEEMAQVMESISLIKCDLKYHKWLSSSQTAQELLFVDQELYCETGARELCEVSLDLQPGSISDLSWESDHMRIK